MLSISSCACWPSIYLIWRNVYSGLLPIFPLGCGFFTVGLLDDVLNMNWVLWLILYLGFWIRLVCKVFFFFFFNGCAHGIWRFPGQRLNLSCSYELCHSCGNTRSFNTLCQAGNRIQAPQQSRCCSWIVNPLDHNRNCCKFFFLHNICWILGSILIIFIKIIWKDFFLYIKWFKYNDVLSLMLFTCKIIWFQFFILGEGSSWKTFPIPYMLMESFYLFWIYFWLLSWRIMHFTQVYL